MISKKDGRIVEYSSAFELSPPVDIFKMTKRGDVEVSKENAHFSVTASKQISITSGNLDAPSWLPWAAKKYEISSDLRDYVIVPVITLPSDLPNRNGVGFPLKALAEFNIEAGMQAYKTFKGKPTFVEHANDIPELASGIILDTFMRPFRNHGNGKLWKVLELLAFDRSKNPTLARSILNRELNSYSMGSTVRGYTCSVCNKEIGKCMHIGARDVAPFKLINGKLAFKKIYGMTGFETSAVAIPAFPEAVSDHLLNL